MYIDENSVFLQQLIDTIPNPIFYKDVNGIYKFCNTAFSEYLGLGMDEIIDHSVYDVSPKELADIYDKADRELIRIKGKQYYETQVKYKDGSYHDVYFIKAVMLDKNSDVAGLVGIMIDITERKRAEDKANRLLNLKDAILQVNHAIMEISNIDELFGLILEKAICSIGKVDTGTILVLDKDNNLQIVAYRGIVPEIAEQFSMKLEDTFIWKASKGSINKTIIVNDIQKFNNIDSAYVLENKQIYGIESAIISPIIINGNLYGFVDVDSRYNNIFDSTDVELLEYFRQQVEIAISKHMLYEETIYLSRYDTLTNVYNRRYFQDLFNEFIIKALRYKESFLMVEFDLDGLKAINDIYGHLAGDEILKYFSYNLGEIIRASDTFARLGGDEFIGIFYNSNYTSIANKLEDLLIYFKENPIILEGNEILCSFSYGIASFPEDGTSYNALISVADKNMYDYKKNFHRKVK